MKRRIRSDSARDKRHGVATRLCTTVLLESHAAFITYPSSQFRQPVYRVSWGRTCAERRHSCPVADICSAWGSTYLCMPFKAELFLGKSITVAFSPSTAKSLHYQLDSVESNTLLDAA